MNVEDQATSLTDTVASVSAKATPALAGGSVSIAMWVGARVPELIQWGTLILIVGQLCVMGYKAYGWLSPRIKALFAR